MTQQEQYLKERVDDQIRWMDKKSAACQTKYKTIKYCEIIAAASIPFLVGFRDTYPVMPVIAGAMGVVIVILGAVQQINKYYENWIGYRTTVEAMRREKFLFITQSGKYGTADAFKIFVEATEAILANENEAWKTILKSKPDNSQGAQ